MWTRRQFAKHVTQSLLLAGLPACVRSSDYSSEDAARLQTQKAVEIEQSGKGPFGELRFEGYRGLAKLPYFDLDAQGQVRTKIELPPVVDFHGHLGWSQMLAPEVDLLAPSPRIEYLMDCDAQEPPCALDLDVYVNSNFTESMHSTLQKETVRTLTIGGRSAATHTIPNLLAEMQRVAVTQATILPIATGLPFDHDATLHILDSIAKAGAGDRLIPFASVHPRASDKIAKLRDYASRGVRGVKLHPEMQRFFPDEDGAMEIYEECGKLGLPIIFHAGRSGIEPEFMRPYALIRRYLPGIEKFPATKFVLGHAGARDVADAIPAAQKYENVWLELSSQGVTQIHELLLKVGESKLLYGTDWPFYPLAVALAKVLIVTEGKTSARAAILGGNAMQLLKKR